MSHVPRTVKRAAFGSAVALSLVAGLLAVPAAAAPGDDIPANTECPSILPVDDLTVGATGTGLTVVKGAEPKPFSVEVLGVLDDGIGAGKDMIIIEASDLPGQNVISAGGGIWSGMSGSPVYINGKLIGAVAYGFSLAPSPIGGVTPAEDMVDLFDLASPAAAAKGAAAKALPGKVSLSAAERKSIAGKAEAAVPAGSLQMLPTPMGLSGLSSKRVAQFQKEADAAGLPVVAYAANKAAAPKAAALTRPEAGGNFAAAQSYGDFTAAGVGTTTVVCDDQALAFGHPFGFAGPVSYGANDGNSVTIIKDDTFGSFKLANITDPFGKVDQDRLAGIRADLTKAPALTPITSDVTNSDTGRQRDGSTLGADQPVMGAITAYGLLANHDAVFDEIGDGRSSSSWVITGTRAGGKLFTLSRTNKFASTFDISGDTAFDPAYAVEELLGQEYEPVTIKSVQLESKLTTKYSHYFVTKMETSVDGGAYTSPKTLRVKGGATLRIRVSMRPYRSTQVVTKVLTTTVPRYKGRSGTLSVTGGATLSQEGGDEGCLISPEECDDQAEGSFDKVLTSIRDNSRNDALVGRIVLEPNEPGQKTVRKTLKKTQTQIVYGQKAITIIVR